MWRIIRILRASSLIRHAVMAASCLCLIAGVVSAQAQDYDDGRWIAFSMGHVETDIYVISEEGGEPFNLTNAADFGQHHSPTWSPDGTQIAFETNRDGDTNYEIYVMDADGKNQKRLTDNEALDREPAWSPNGRLIAFSSRRDGNWEIYTMTPKGENLTRLTDHRKTDRVPKWAPNGQQLVFASQRDRGWEIYKMDADGSNVVRLTDSIFKEETAAWSPDGTKIAFTSNRTGDTGIFVMDTNGENVVELVELANSPTWSTDGTKIAFLRGLNEPAGLWIVDSDGVGEEQINGGIHHYEPQWRPTGLLAVQPAGKWSTHWALVKTLDQGQ